MVKPVVDTFTLIEGNNFADFMDSIMTLLQIFSFWATDGRYVQACSLSLSLSQGDVGQNRRTVYH